MERVYLGDWLYNAGIVGFLRINSYLWEINGRGSLLSKDEGLLRFGDNYIEFDRGIFEGFAERYFGLSFKEFMDVWGHTDKLISFKAGLESLKPDEDVAGVWENIYRNIAQINPRKKYNFPGSIPRKVSSASEAIEVLINLVDYLSDLPEDIKHRKAVDWLRYTKLIHRNYINSLTLDSFKRDVELSILNSSLENEYAGRGKNRTAVPCSVCYPLRTAKKGKAFTTSMSSFAGLNADCINFIYMEENKKPQNKVGLPLCEICEVIYLCTFAGLTYVRLQDGVHFYFVNSDSSVEELIKENSLLKHILQEEKGLLTDFFTKLNLQTTYRHALFSLQNVSVIELNLENESMPVIHSLNLPRSKAEFFKDNREDLEKLSKSFYRIGKEGDKNTKKVSILPEIVNLILESKFYFNYLQRLLKIYIATLVRNENYYTNISPYQLQLINLLVYKFLKKVGGLDMAVSEKELWFIYNKGAELAEKLEGLNQENKIRSIAQKLLNALRVGDAGKFMDTLLRVYNGYRLEIPSTLVKILSGRKNFEALGYSFVNGLLSGKKGGE